MDYFDAHSDLLTAIHYRRLAGEKNIFRNNYYDAFIEGNVKKAIFVLWTDEAHVDTTAEYIEDQLQTAKILFKEEKDVIEHILTPEDLDKSDDKIHVMLGMEGLMHIGEDIDLLDFYYREHGLRHGGLTWNEENALGKGPSFSGGLSEKGKEAVRKMQNLGILVDLSHLNDDGFWDVLEIAEKPVVATHSNARDICNHRRNLTDEMLRELAQMGGMAGINAAVDFIHRDKDKQDLDHMIQMMAHMVDIMGVDHVFFGFDFMEFLPQEAQGTMAPLEGETSTPRDFLFENDVPNLIEKMREHGFTEGEIQKIGHDNIVGLLKKIL